MNRVRIIKQSGDAYTVLCPNGVEKIVRYTQKEKKMIRDGVLLQPYGKEKDSFLEKYQYLPDEDKKDTDKYLSAKGLFKKNK